MERTDKKALASAVKIGLLFGKRAEKIPFHLQIVHRQSDRHTPNNKNLFLVFMVCFQ
jgi:hypothetical protein